MANNIVVTVATGTQSAPIADTPASLLVTLEGQVSVSLPIEGPYVATFAAVVDGTYAGTVQAARADGSLIGVALTFSVTANADTVQAVVPTGVTVSVTAA